MNLQEIIVRTKGYPGHYLVGATEEKLLMSSIVGFGMNGEL